MKPVPLQTTKGECLRAAAGMSGLGSSAPTSMSTLVSLSLNVRFTWSPEPLPLPSSYTDVVPDSEESSSRTEHELSMASKEALESREEVKKLRRDLHEAETQILIERDNAAKWDEARREAKAHCEAAETEKVEAEHRLSQAEVSLGEARRGLTEARQAAADALEAASRAEAAMVAAEKARAQAEDDEAAMERSKAEADATVQQLRDALAAKDADLDGVTRSAKQTDDARVTAQEAAATASRALSEARDEARIALQTKGEAEQALEESRTRVMTLEESVRDLEARLDVAVKSVEQLEIQSREREAVLLETTERARKLQGDLEAHKSGTRGETLLVHARACKCVPSSSVSSSGSSRTCMGALAIISRRMKAPTSWRTPRTNRHSKAFDARTSMLKQGGFFLELAEALLSLEFLHAQLYPRVRRSLCVGAVLLDPSHGAGRQRGR